MAHWVTRSLAGRRERIRNQIDSVTTPDSLTAPSLQDAMSCCDGERIRPV